MLVEPHLIHLLILKRFCINECVAAGCATFYYVIDGQASCRVVCTPTGAGVGHGADGRRDNAHVHVHRVSREFDARHTTCIQCRAGRSKPGPAVLVEHAHEQRGERVRGGRRGQHCVTRRGHVIRWPLHRVPQGMILYLSSARVHSET